MKKVFAGYAVLLAVHLGAIEFDFSLLRYGTKVLLMPYLIGLALMEGRSASATWILVAALGFSWLGDILLLFSEDTYFTLGLLAFMMAHLCYIRIFIKDASISLVRPLPFVGYAVLVLSRPFFQDIPAHLLIPVYSYMAVITTMSVVASLRNPRLPGYAWIVAGAGLFMISDSLLAVHTFSKSLPWAGPWIMLTYGLGQFFIVKGYFMHSDSVSYSQSD